MFRKLILLSLMILMLLISGISAQEEANCGIQGWVIDKDPNGTNVRNQPGVNGKVIAKLPHKGNSDDDLVTVYITGYSNGWVKIARAEMIDGTEIFDDIGWISSKMVVTGTKGSRNYMNPVNLYLHPSGKKSVGTIPAEVNVQIIGFSCGWVKVNYQKKSGWIRTENVCGNPVTTCS